MHIRDAGTGDIDGITAIYNDAVANTTAIWNETLVDAANRAAWPVSYTHLTLPTNREV